MRTTFALDDALLEQARREALAQKISLAKYIETALREKLAEEAHEPLRSYLPLKTFKGNGLQASLDLNDTASLLQIMDEPL